MQKKLTESRGQKALINTAVLGVYQFVYFLCGLILPRFLLLEFGSEYNGAVSSITQFLNFISVLQLGIAGATRFSLYKVLAEKDIKGISGIVNATEKYMRKIGLVLIAYIGVLVFAFPKFANTNLPTGEIALLVLIIGASTFSQYFFGITYQILLAADQRQYFYYSIATVATILNTIIAVILIKLGQSIFAVKAGSALIFVMVPVMLSVFVKKRYSIDKSVPQNKAGIKGRKDVMWHSIANIVHDNSAMIALTLCADVKTISVYTVHCLVINGLYKILSIFTNSLEAGFGNMFAKSENKTAYKNLEHYEFFMCAFVSVVFSCALVLIVPFVKIYTKGVNDVDYIQPVFAYVAVIAQMIMCIRQPYLTVVQAAGHYKQTRNGAFVEAALNVIISLVATYFLGIVGVAIGVLVANSVRTFQYMLYLKSNILNRPLRKPLLMLMWTALNVIIIFSLGTICIKFMVLDFWAQWIMAGMISVVIALSITLLFSFVFCKSQLCFFLCMVKRILFKKK